MEEIKNALNEINLKILEIFENLIFCKECIIFLNDEGKLGISFPLSFNPGDSASIINKLNSILKREILVYNSYYICNNIIYFNEEAHEKQLIDFINKIERIFENENSKID